MSDEEVRLAYHVERLAYMRWFVYELNLKYDPLHEEFSEERLSVRRAYDIAIEARQEIDKRALIARVKKTNA
jgi:hypothetical protein